MMAFIAVTAFSANVSAQEKSDEYKYVNAEELMILNKGFDNTELTFSRLPEDMKPVTRKDVWDLGLNSAGIAVRFSSNAKKIKARWTLLNNFRMNHMATTGICGLDLYMLNDKGQWQFAGNARPSKQESENVFGSGKLSGEWHEYMIYLPLYDGVTKFEIGIDPESEIAAPRNNVMVKGGKPVLFYGTSVTQGGCASRPGMVYTSILSRKWQKEVINLGFSGNARMDKSMAETIKRVDAEKYVLDCLPNCTTQILRDSAEVFIKILADAHPDTPIYMVENMTYAYELTDSKTVQDQVEKNGYWKELYKKLRKEGYKNLRYIPRDKLTGKDGEDSVDGAHRTDLGFQRMAEAFMKYIK
jgi:hypothetical protein